MGFRAGIIDTEVVIHGAISTDEDRHQPSPTAPAATTTVASSASVEVDAGAGAGAPRAVSAGDRSAAMLAHTYGRKEAQEAQAAMAADMAARGMGRMHPVDKHAHGWLTDPDGNTYEAAKAGARRKLMISALRHTRAGGDPTSGMKPSRARQLHDGRPEQGGGRV